MTEKSYDRIGGYGGYNHNHSERQKNDYYASDTIEVENFLKNYLHFNPTPHDRVLEPCCGGGHMLEGIYPCCESNTLITGTDLIDYGYKSNKALLQYNLDFLSPDYPFKKSEYVIMNPPFKQAIPFVQKGLEIATKQFILFSRLQFLETEKRYEEVIEDYPPNDIYIYVDRIACYKNGDTTLPKTGSQAYAWYVWNKDETNFDYPRCHWIRRANKIKK